MAPIEWHYNSLSNNIDEDKVYENIKIHYSNINKSNDLIKKLNKTFDNNVLFNIYYQYCKKCKEEELSMNKEIYDYAIENKEKRNKYFIPKLINQLPDFNNIDIIKTSIEIKHNDYRDFIKIIERTKYINFNCDDLEKDIINTKPKFLKIDNIFVLELIKYCEKIHYEFITNINFEKIILNLENNKFEYEINEIKNLEKEIKKNKNNLKKINTIRIVKQDYINALNIELEKEGKCVKSSCNLNIYKSALNKYNIDELTIRQIKKQNIIDEIYDLGEKSKNLVVEFNKKEIENKNKIAELNNIKKDYDCCLNNDYFINNIKKLYINRIYFIHNLKKEIQHLDNKSIDFIMNLIGYTKIKKQDKRYSYYISNAINKDILSFSH